MTAADIIGHTEQLAQLQNDIASKNVAHAYMFLGSPRLGKMAVADWFARELLTQGLSSEERELAEGQIDRLIHPDLLRLDQLWMEETCEDPAVIGRTTNITQEHRRKAGAKTDRISIDDVRALQERLYEKPTRQYRCCIIRSIERMEDPPANAFLKVLEEPPPGMIFLLTAESRTSVLPTMLSRCRIMQFRRVGDRDLAPMLKGVAEEDQQFLRHVAQGAPGIIERLKRDPDALLAEKQLHAQATAFWAQKSPLQRQKLLAPLLERDAMGDRFALHLCLALRESSGFTPANLHTLMECLKALETNAHRGLIVSKFAMAV